MYGYRYIDIDMAAAMPEAEAAQVPIYIDV